MENKKLENAKKLMERFADAKILETKEFDFRVYALKKDKDGVFSNLKLGISYPSPFSGDSYFVAEVAVKLSPRGGNALFKHAFQLDHASLKIELEKIDYEKAQEISSPERISSIFNELYHEIAEHLVDYNDNGVRDNYVEIADALMKKRSISHGKKFGI